MEWNLSVNKESWTSIFKSLKKVCKETRLREFQFKLIHRIVITRKELFIFGIKTNDECLYCGDKDSIEHTFIECTLTRSFAKKVIQLFNETNCCQISPTTEKLLFGIIPSCKETKLINKFNYTTLSMRHCIYSNKIISESERSEGVCRHSIYTAVLWYQLQVSWYYWFFLNFFICNTTYKIYNTLHYLHYSHYLQHSTMLRFLSLLHTQRTHTEREKNEKEKEKKKKKGKKLLTTYVLSVL